MKVYISGPMTGIAGFNHLTFNRKAAELRALGHEVVNPAELPEIPGGTWHDYMRADIPAMLTCEGIYQLPNWVGSKGAQLEFCIAFDLDMFITGAPE